MAHKKLKAAPRHKGTASGNAKLTSVCTSENSAHFDLRQDLIDPVVILAARSRVSPATIRAQLAAWQIGGAHV